MICLKCLRDFPDDVLQEFEECSIVNGKATVITRVQKICPICALAIRNATHGLSPDTPFNGPKARALYERAVRHLARYAK